MTMPDRSENSINDELYGVQRVTVRKGWLDRIVSVDWLTVPVRVANAIKRGLPPESHNVHELRRLLAEDGALGLRMLPQISPRALRELADAIAIYDDAGIHG